MQRTPGFSPFSIDSLMAPTPGPRLMTGATSPFMYGGYVLFPGVGGLPLSAPALGTGGLPMDLGLPRPVSPTRGATSTRSKAHSAGETGPSGGEATDPVGLSAFHPRAPPPPPAPRPPGSPVGFSSASGRPRGLKPVPGPHPASSQPLPPARPGSASPPTPAGYPHPHPQHPLSLYTPAAAAVGGIPPHPYPVSTATTSPADLTFSSTQHKTSQKGKQNSCCDFYPDQTN